MIDKIKNFNNCYGCEACFNACEKHAISMKPSTYGFLFHVLIMTNALNAESALKYAHL